MSLIHWWSLIGNLNDQIGISSLNGTPSYGDGKIGQCAVLGDDKILTSNISFAAEWNPIQTSVSIAGWAKFNKADIETVINKISPTEKSKAPTGCLFGSHSYGGLALVWLGNNMYEGGKKIENFSTLKIFAAARGVTAVNGKDSATANTSAFTVEFDKWYHFALVANKNTYELSLYVNGTKYHTVNYSNIKEIPNNLTFGVNQKQVYGGNGPGTAIPFLANDVRLYDHALSALEVKQLSQGLAIHYTFDDILIEPTINLLEKNSASFSNLTFLNAEHFSYSRNDGIYTITVGTQKDGAATGQFRMSVPLDILTTGQSYYCSFKYKIISGNGIYQPIDWCDSTISEKKIIDCGDFYQVCAKCSTSREYSSVYRFLDASLSINSTIQIWDIQLQTNALPTPYVDGVRSSMLYNETGFVQPSGVNNLSLSSNSRIGKYCGKFNGTNTYIDTPIVKSNMFTDDYTLNFWVYHNEGDDRAVYFGDYETTNKMQFNIERTSEKKLRYYHAANPDHKFSFTIPDKQWTMITLKYVKSETKLYAYLNGDIDNKESFSHTPTLTKTNGIIKIGMDGRTSPGVTPLNGYIDDFRFYCSALSDNDIQDLYNCGASLSDLGDAHANSFIENATYHGVDEYHNIQANEIYEDVLGPDYQQLEYLQSTGTQYIDTGYITTSSRVGYWLDMAWTGSTISNFESFMGFITSGSNPRIGLHNRNSLLMFGANTTAYSTVAPVQNERYIYFGDFESGKQRLYKNGVQIATHSQTFLHSTNSVSTYIFARNIGSSTSSKNCAKMKLYEAKLYENNELKRHYLPARKKSDNTLGLYEVITKQFLTNSGTGTFTAGPAVTVNESSAFTENKNFTSRQIIEI